MKNFLLLLGFVLSLPSLKAATTVVTVVSPEEILEKKASLTCEVFRRKDSSVSLKLSATALSGAKNYFEGFDLRVFKKPMAASEIADKVLREDSLAWHRPSSVWVTVFVLTEEEIPQSYIVGRWSVGPDSSGVLQVKHVCFSVDALVKAAAMVSNQRR